jgi:hypothetical protein
MAKLNLTAASELAVIACTFASLLDLAYAMMHSKSCYPYSPRHIHNQRYSIGQPIVETLGPSLHVRNSMNLELIFQNGS